MLWDRRHWSKGSPELTSQSNPIISFKPLLKGLMIFPRQLQLLLADSLRMEVTLLFKHQISSLWLHLPVQKIYSIFAANIRHSHFLGFQFSSFTHESVSSLKLLPNMTIYLFIWIGLFSIFQNLPVVNAGNCTNLVNGGVDFTNYA